ncbi:MAG: hypothetical protein L3J31_02655 [Bacteroidales bacterium]|nr:hypothetical protein [Bacteroidales bacterium]MCF6341691.1 hypothetical protein [Bacteroidales bacterium]
MYRKTIIAAVALILFSLQTAFGQGEGRFVTVGDTTINLADVDLEKGMVILRKKFIIDTATSGPTEYRVSIRVFSGTVSENYAMVYDTLWFLNRSKYNYYRSTSIQYYNGNKEMLFKKHYKYFIDRLYISSSGEAVLFRLVSEDLAQVHLYTKNGALIKKYEDGYERLYVGLKHKYFFMCNHNDYQGPNIYDRIDKSGNIEEVIFPSGFFRGIKFSPKENFYLVLLDKDQLLYDINNNLMWRIEDYNSAIIISSDEKKYLTRNFSIGSIAVKDLFNHEIIYSINHVLLHNEQMAIYRWKVIDSNFYTIGKNKDFYVYNFYNQRGELLQTETTDININYRTNKITKEAGKFVISPKSSNDQNK